MKSIVIIVLLVVILVIIMYRTVSSFDLTENGSGSCQACPTIAAGFKYSSPANGCATTACPTGYTTGTDPTNCTDCATGYSKTGTGASAACTPTVTTCLGHQSVVNNVCTNCSLPTNSIWNAATGCATTACPQNSTANAEGTICTCYANYTADSTKTACVGLSCTGRTQISGSPIAVLTGGNANPLQPGNSISITPGVTTPIGAAAQAQNAAQQQELQKSILAQQAAANTVGQGTFAKGGPGK